MLLVPNVFPMSTRHKLDIGRVSQYSIEIFSVKMTHILMTTVIVPRKKTKLQ